MAGIRYYVDIVNLRGHSVIKEVDGVKQSIVISRLDKRQADGVARELNLLATLAGELSKLVELATPKRVETPILKLCQFIQLDNCPNFLKSGGDTCPIEGCELRMDKSTTPTRYYDSLGNLISEYEAVCLCKTTTR